MCHFSFCRHYLTKILFFPVRIFRNIFSNVINTRNSFVYQGQDVAIHWIKKRVAGLSFHGVKEILTRFPRQKYLQPLIVDIYTMFLVNTMSIYSGGEFFDIYCL